MNPSTNASPPAATSARRHDDAPGPRANPWLLWFVALGGSACWTVQLLLSWSLFEIACLGTSMPGPGAFLFTGLAIGVPFVVTLVAIVVGLSMRRRVLPKLRADDLAASRVSLMLTVGLVLDFLALAAILCGGIAVLVLEPCQ